MNFINKIDKDITLLLDNLPVGIIRFNDKHKCIYANRFVINLLGLDPSKSDTDISKIYMNAIHNEDRESEINTCITFMETHKESHSTFRIFNKQTNEYTWMTNKRNIIYSDNTISFMFTLQDVNENKLLEIQLRNETIRAEKAYNHKSIFLANMSHEIRTPLNGIIGMLTLLEDTFLTNDQKDYILMVKECSFNLMTIINDILDYSKLEVGKISLDTRSMNIRECIETTNDIVLSKIYEKSLEYSYNIDQNIPEYIYGDTNRIKQILLNLLSNSIKFTESGNIMVHINKISEKDFISIQNQNHHISKHIIDKALQNNNNMFKNKLFLRFDIFDSGCGINSHETDKLFKSFSQVDNQITSKIYQGTGLGLAISKELVELMDGTIWLDWSEINKGSKFSFILPTLECINEETNDKKSQNVLNNANVLIVDDNIHNRISLTGMITKWGMKPHIFSNGEEALHFTKLIHFDIGLIDICMPKMDGHSFAKKLRDQTEFKNKEFPLVALSSLGDKLTSNDKNFKTHLIKPIKESRLKNICIDLLQMRKNEPEKQQSTINMLDQYINQNNISELKSNVRILLAEDVYINQKVVTSFLNKLGYDNIKVVDNGQQCLDIAINNDFDVILLDIRMPIMNGEVVLQKLHEYYNKESKIRPFIVAVTAYCLREDKQRYLDMGFDDYIPKPITLNELKRCLDKFIQTILSK